MTLCAFIYNSRRVEIVKDRLYVILHKLLNLSGPQKVKVNLDQHFPACGPQIPEGPIYCQCPTKACASQNCLSTPACVKDCGVMRFQRGLSQRARNTSMSYRHASLSLC